MTLTMTMTMTIMMMTPTITMTMIMMISTYILVFAVAVSHSPAKDMTSMPLVGLFKALGCPDINQSINIEKYYFFQSY